MKRSREYMAVAVWALASIGVACERSVVVPCEGLRSLRVGMSRADVVARLGDPIDEFPFDGSRMQVRQEVDWILDCDTDDGWDDGVTLLLEMSKGRLAHVSSYRKPMFSASEDEEEQLFGFDHEGSPKEGPGFEKYLCVPR